ncbi:MAG: pirin family protein [Gammaproteobacteria bacterium]
MITLRKSTDRGHANHGWLDTYHSFSFDTYYDPAHMGVSVLRVINEDRISPGGGFPPHDHRDMEIITYILEGALEHKDSMGNRSVIRPGEVQRMSAGTGVTHSEFNASDKEPVHLLQIWILPDIRGIEPGYEQTRFPEEERRGKLRLVASPDGENGSVRIHQQARVYAALVDGEEVITHPTEPGRTYYLQLGRGSIQLGEQLLKAGDGATITGEEEILLHRGEAAELLLFDLP